jgi:biotin-(acetyl-CoA carboxylase) ligase
MVNKIQRSSFLMSIFYDLDTVLSAFLPNHVADMLHTWRDFLATINDRETEETHQPSTKQCTYHLMM